MAYNLTQRPTGYPHSQVVNDTPVKTVSAVFDGADATVVKGSAIATSDVFELISIPAGALVLAVAAKVTTAEGGTCTFDIGDDADTDGYIDGANGNSTSTFAWNSLVLTEASPNTVTGFSAGKLYTAANTIDLLLATGTAANVVVEVSATYVMVDPVAT